MKILIVDDHQGMREMMRSFLPASFGEICECDDGFDALDCYRTFLPDWVLMDWEMKRMDGLAATRGIIGSFPTARILMVSQYCDKELRRAANEAGVCGFFPKDNLLDLRDFFKNQQLITHKYMKTRLNTIMILFGLSLCFVMFGTATAAQAATFTVDTTVDNAALNACTDAANDCSLRGAINNANSLAGADTINFDAAVFSSAQTIKLDNVTSNPSDLKELVINSDLTINGPGAGNLTVQGSDAYFTSIFNISVGNVGINNLKLTGGSGKLVSNRDGIQELRGGAIYMTGGTVTVAGSTLSVNGAQYGGAIFLSGGSLAVTGSTISDNDIGDRGYGGGIYMNGGAVTITNSAISKNTARIGGGIYNGGGVINITNSTVNGNVAKPDGGDNSRGFGGGILNVVGTLTVTNSTISRNRADGYLQMVASQGGGGIYNWYDGTAIIMNSTITDNYGQRGGGIKNFNSAANSLTLSNSIVAGNSAADVVAGNGAPNGNRDVYSPEAVVNGDYNLVQDTSGYILSGTHNITGQDPKLGPLANNGGPTLTHALLEGSPAVDAGDPNFNSASLPYDQRGAGFPRVVNGRVDIGAFEGLIYQNNLVVNTLADHDDGFCDQSDCTLREAVKYAAAPGATVSFSVSGTIALTSGEIAIAKILTINGPASAPGITVSGNNQSRIFYISSSGTVNLSTLTLSKGNGAGSTNSGNGGAIYSDGTVNVANCTFTGNTATGNAGAIRSGSTLTVMSSTFTSNTASSGGGAIQFANSATITNSTISGNTAGTVGGGINNNSGATNTNPVNLSNSIVAGNSAPTGPDFNGKVTGGDYNLIQNTSGATLAGTHNIIGQSALLGALADNGGATKTMALLPGSPAINAGDPNFDTTATPFDQRGAGFARKVGSAIDIGAFEVQPVSVPADLTIAKSHIGNFNQGDTAKTYSITVTNSGGTATNGTVTVVDTLPSGLTATGISGAGWTCTLGTLTCTRTDALAAAGTYSAITVTVNVAANASSSVTNTATVSVRGETNTANNTATDPTTITATATYSIAGQVLYGTTASGAAARAVPGVTLNASGTPSAAAVSNSSGVYQLSGLGSGAYTVTPAKSGDANHITANDALLVQRYGAYAADLTANQLIAADTNSDNQVNSTDALYIQQYLAYVNTATANITEQWKFLPGSRNYTTLSGSLTNQNYTAVLVGDVDGDWVAPGTNAPLQAAPTISEPENAAEDIETNANDTNANETKANQTNANDGNVNQPGIEKPRPKSKESIEYPSPSATETATAAAVSSVTVSLPTNAASSTGTSLTIPITVSQLPALTDANVVRTYAFNVQYDATVLQYTGFDTTGTLSGGSGVVCGQPPADATNNQIVSCNFVNVNGITGAGTLLKLNFTVVGTSGQQSALTFVGTARQPNPFIFNTNDPQAAVNNGSFAVLGTTAAAVSISGRVTTMSGRGIVNVRLSLTDSNGEVRTATTTAFGDYRFEAVQAGETYILSASSKRFTFSQPVQVLNVNEETNEVNFVANSEKKLRSF